MQVGDAEPLKFNNFAYGRTYSSGTDGVEASITAALSTTNPHYVQVTYTLENKGAESVTVRIGSYGDTQIGSDDSARVSFLGNTGILMQQTQGGTNQFGLIPTTDADGFTTMWYGLYYLGPGNVFNNLNDTSPSSGDSAIAWSWTIEIPAGETVTRSADIGIAENIVKTVVLDPNGGVGSPKTQTVIDGSSITLAENTFTREHYSFYSWNTKADGSGTSYANKGTVPSSAITDGSTLTLYAQWKPEEYTVATQAVPAAGGSVIGGGDYEYESDVTVTATPATGYLFDHWIIDVDEENPVLDLAYSFEGIAEDHTADAYFLPITYSIAFDANSGEGTMDPMEAVNYDESVTLTANAFMRDGYTFAGWNTAADGSGTSYDDAASVINLTAEDSATVVLYAQWEPVPAPVPAPRGAIPATGDALAQAAGPLGLAALTGASALAAGLGLRRRRAPRPRHMRA